ncbi:MAG: alpha/beta hydrolase [Ethanoligenens sp.]
MHFREFGDSTLPSVILIHGGGLSWWSWQPIIDALEAQYHLIVPTIDGHDDDGDTTFCSIADSAEKLIAYVDKSCGGQVYALAGLSIGAQIIVEVLARREKITRFAVIESALVYPIPASGLMAALTPLVYGLLKYRWFAKQQAAVLQIPDAAFERYYTSSLRMSCMSLRNITRSNGRYPLPSHIEATDAKVLILVGGKEIGIMKKSAVRLHEAIPGSVLHVLPGWKHGAASLIHTDVYLHLLQDLFDGETAPAH